MRPKPKGHTTSPYRFAGTGNQSRSKRWWAFFLYSWQEMIMAEDTGNQTPTVQVTADDGEEARQNLDDMTVLQNDNSVNLDAEQQQGHDGSRNQNEDLQSMSTIQMGSRVIPNESVTTDAEIAAVESGTVEVEKTDNEAPVQAESNSVDAQEADGGDFAITPPTAGIASQAGFQFGLPETEVAIPANNESEPNAAVDEPAAIATPEQTAFAPEATTPEVVEEEVAAEEEAVVEEETPDETEVDDTLLADGITLTPEAAAGNEDGWIDINLNVSQEDGAEQLVVKIEGVPEGSEIRSDAADAFLAENPDAENPIVDNGDGTWTITGDFADGLQLLPPADSNEDFTLNVTATTTETSSGLSNTVTADLNVTVASVADAPELSAADATGNEDATTIPLNIETAITDMDGSESITSVVISGVPDTVTLSAGTDNGDGTWTLEAGDLDGLSATVDGNVSGVFDMGVTVNVLDVDGDSGGDDTTSSSTSFTLTVNPDADEVTFTAGSASGAEDSWIDVNSSFAVTDTDGSEAVTGVTITGIPEGATLQMADGTPIEITDGSATLSMDQVTDNGDGSYSLAGLQVMAPADSNENFELGIRVTTTDDNGVSTDSEITTGSISVEVASVADAPDLSAADATGNEDATTIPLNIETAITDMDGSESITSVVISGVPDTVTLSAGTDNGDGTWTLEAGDLDGLSATVDGNVSGVFDMGVTVNVLDVDGDSGGDDTTSSSTSFTLTVNPDADEVTFTAGSASGAEDSWIDVNSSFAVTDTDGSEAVTGVTITGIPEGATLQMADGTPIEITDGSATLSMDQVTDNGDGSYSLAGLQVMAPADSNENFELGIRVTTTDDNGVSTDSEITTGSISVEVASVADAPDLSAADATGNEDATTIPLNIETAITDMDGSESITSVVISGVPDTVTLSAGTDNGDGTWTLEAGDLDGLSATVDGNVSGVFDMGVTVNVLDVDGDSGGDDTTSSSTSFTLTVNPDADEVTFTAGSASGAEDSWIDVNSSFAITDTDGSEAVTGVTITGIPEGATLQMADGTPIEITDGSATLSMDQVTDNGDGSYSLAGLQVMAPADSNDNFELGIRVTTTDDNGATTDSEITNGTISVEVASVADAPELSAGDVTGGEDATTIPLDIASAVTDMDGSESITSVVISGVPDTVTLSAGTDNGDGTWTLEAGDLDGLSATVDGNVSGVFDMGVTVNVLDADGDSGGDDTSSASTSFTLTVNPDADEVTFTAGSASGAEDSWIDVNSSFAVTDTDGSEAVTGVTITGIPEGATLQMADGTPIEITDGSATLSMDQVTDNGDGSYSLAGLQVMAPADSNENFELGIRVTTTDDNGVSTDSEITNGTISVEVSSVADAPELSAGDVTGGEDATTIPLDIASAVTDMDGSESITSVVISGVPDTVTLSAGTDNGDGTWTLEAGDLDGLSATVDGNVSGVFDMGVTVNVLDADGDSGGDDTSSASTSFTLTVNPDADEVTFTAGSASGAEDSWIDVNSSFAVTDTDGSEAVTGVTITGIPEGATLQMADGTPIEITDGSATLSMDQVTDNGDGSYSLAGLQVMAPADSNENFELGIRVTTTDDNGVSTDSEITNGTISVEVSSVADAPELSAGDVTGGEDATTIPLDIASAVTDMDGSESITSVVISGVPDTVTLSAGTDNGDGTWTLEAGDLDGLSATVDGNVSGVFDMGVTVNVLDADGDSGGDDTSSASTSFTLTVNPDADEVTFTAGSASGAEDSWIDVNSSFAVTDTDGSEAVTGVTITGIPEGATLQMADGTPIEITDGSATLSMDQVTDNGDGSYSLAGLQVMAPADSNENFELGIRVTTTDDNGVSTDSEITNGTISVEVASVADAPELSAGDVTGGEDATTIPLDIASAVTDMDGSESITSVVISGVPDTVTLSAGTDNGDGTWTLEAGDLDGLSATVDGNVSGVFDMGVTVNVLDVDGDSGGDDTTSSSTSFTLTVNPDADEVTFTAGSASGAEDSWIDVNSSFAVTDTDGSEAVTGVTITGIPEGATLQMADGTPIEITDGSATLSMDQVTDNGDGSYSLAGLQVMAPADSNENFELGIRVTTTDDNGVSTDSEITNGSISVEVSSVADAPELSAGDVTGGEDATTIPLDIASAVTDMDGSESITSVVISGVPDTVTLSAGTDNGDGTWTLEAGDLDGLSATVDGNVSGVFDMGVTVNVLDADGDSGGDDTSSASTSFTLTVNPDADEVTFTAGSASGAEDSWIDVNSSFAVTDTDGSEAVTGVTITGIPEGATLQMADGTPIEITDGSATLSMDQVTDNGDGSYSLAGLQVMAPADSNENFELGIRVTTTDDNGVSTDSEITTGSISVEVASVADAPELSAADATGNEDATTIPLNIETAITDMDGSESITSVVISGVPDTVTLSAGTDNGDGTWTLEAGDLDGLSATVDGNVSGVFDMGVTVNVLDADGDSGGDDTSSASTSFTLTVNPDADEVTFTAGSASGAEDSWIDVNSSFAVTDTDGSEAVTGVTITGIPEGATLQMADGTPIEITDGSATLSMDQVTDNGDGSYSLAGLQVMAPADSNENFELGIRVTTTDDNGVSTDSEITTGSISVEVASVADAPELSAADASGNEDATTIPLDIAAAVTDTDGSESITSVVISDVPDTVTLSAGTDNGDGTWTLSVEDLDGLSATVDGDVSGVFNMGVTVNVLDVDGDSGGDDTTSVSSQFTLTVNPEADGVEITAGSASGSEDQWISVNEPTFIIQDSDGSESVTGVTITGIPEGTELRLADGTEITVEADGTAVIPMGAVSETATEGTFTIDGLEIKAPSDSNVDFSLGITVETTDTNGVTSDTVLDSGAINVEVVSVADAPDLVANDVTGNEDAATINLDIATAVTDVDGSESISSVVITNVPESMTLSAGTDNGDGTWTLEVGDLEGLTASVEGDLSGSWDLGVTVNVLDADADGAAGDDVTSRSTNFTVTVTPDADGVTITDGSGSGVEDQWISVNEPLFEIQDTDGSETVTGVTITGIPEGAEVRMDDGTAIEVTDGSATIPMSYVTDLGDNTFTINGLEVKAPADSNANFSLGIDIETTDSNGVTSDTTIDSGSISIEVISDADAPDLSAGDVTGGEDATTIPLDIASAVTDMDGSESITSVVISGVPDTVTLSAGTDNGDGTWTLEAGDLDGLSATVDGNVSGVFDMGVTVNVLDADGDSGGDDTTSASTSFTLTVNPDADEVTFTAGSASGAEDSWIDVNSSFAVTDTDGSEAVTGVTITGIPEGATLQMADGTPIEITDGSATLSMDQVTDNGDGSYSLAGLQVMAPADSNENFELGIRVTTTDDNGVSTDTEITNGSISVEVASVADAPELSAGDVTGGEDATTIPLDIASAVTDMDGSESITSVVISGVPDTVTLSAGTDNGDGTWTLEAGDLDGLSATVDGNVSGVFDMGVTVNVLDADGDSGGDDTSSASTSFTLTVNPDADEVTFTAGSASGAEDSWIDVNSSFAVTDTDGSEAVTGVTITGIPEGATLQMADGTPIEITDGSATLSMDQVTDNGDGSYSLAGLQVMAPADSNDNFELGIRVTTTDDNGATTDSEITNGTISVEVASVADAPELSAGDVTGGEDATTIPLDIASAVTDMDGSESITSVVISGVPDTVTLSAGTDNGDGTWTLEAGDLDGLSATVDGNVSGVFDMGVTVNVLDADGDSGGDDTSSASTSFTLTVNPDADEVTFTAGSASGAEDSWIDVNSSFAVTDTDGSEAVTGVTITGIPEGATLQMADGTPIEITDGSATLSMDQVTDNGDGSYSLAGLQVMAPADSNDNFELGIRVTTTDDNGATTDSEITTGTISVEVASVADAPELSAGDVTGGEDATTIPLDIASAVTDMDGSESITSVVISGVPDTVTLSAGTDNGDGTWTLEAGDLDGLSATVDGNVSGVFDMGVTVNVLDADGDSGGDDTSSSSTSFTLTVNPDADEVTFTAGSASGAEDSWIDVNSSFAVTDTDGSEAVTGVTITGIPEGATLQMADGTPIEITDGSATLSMDQVTDNGDGSYSLAGLQVMAPADSNVDFELGIRVTTIDDNGATTDTEITNGTISVEVTGVADDPSLTVNDTTGTEDQAITLDISGGLADVDGSETLVVTIGGVPAGAQLSAGTDNGDGTWTITSTGDAPVDFSAIQLTDLPEDYSGKFDLDVSWNLNDVGDDGVTVDDSLNGSSSFTVTVNPDADAPDLNVGDVVGQEDATSIPLDIAAAVTDTDGSESITSVVISDVPDTVTLSAGTDNGDGTWTLSVGDLDGLSATVDGDVSGVFNMGVTVHVLDDGANSGGTDTTSVSSQFTLTVNPEADGVEITAGSASGREDQWISVNEPTFALQDTDGSESVTGVTLTGIPDGTEIRLADGTEITVNADGTAVIPMGAVTETATEGTFTIDGLEIKAPSDSNVDFSLGITVETTDSNGVTSDTVLDSGAINVEVVSVADAPDLVANNVAGNEDAATIPLDIAAAVTDMDGSESITSVVISGVPDTVTLSAGTDNGDGTWTLEAGDLDGLSATVDGDVSGVFDMGVTVNVLDADADGAAGDDTTSRSTSFTLTVNPDSDGVSIVDGSASGLEDQWISVNEPVFTLLDTDGSEHVTGVVITGIPAGAELQMSDGTPINVNNGRATIPMDYVVEGDAENSYTINGLEIKAPADSNVDFELGIRVTTTDSNGVTNDTARTNGTISVEVTGVADDPSLAFNDTTGTEDQAITLDISGGLADVDGSETLVVTIGGVPAGAQLSAGTDNGDGTWTITSTGDAPVDFSAIQLTDLPEDYSGQFGLDVSWNLNDYAEDGVTVDDALSGSSSFTVTVNPDADEVSVTSSASGSEDSWIDVSTSFAITDNDGSESVGSVTFSGLPAGASLQIVDPDSGDIIDLGTSTGTGDSFTIPAEYVVTSDHENFEVVGLQVQAPADSNVDFNMNLNVEVTDDNGITTDTITSTNAVHVEVVGVADGVQNMADAQDVDVREDNWFYLNSSSNGPGISSDLIDTDGSEQIFYQINADSSDVKLQVKVGNNWTTQSTDGDGNWNVSAADVDSGKVRMYGGSNEDSDFTVNVNAYTKDFAEDGSTVDDVSSLQSTSFSVNVQSDADGTKISFSGAGVEDTAITINNSIQLNDTDGSESLQGPVIISGVPEGATLSIVGDNAGFIHDNGDGSYSIDQEALSPTANNAHGDYKWEIPGLTFTPAENDSTDVKLTFTTTTVEATDDGNGYATQLTSKAVTIRVDADADGATINTVDAHGLEDHAISLEPTITLNGDIDGSETILGDVIITSDDPGAAGATMVVNGVTIQSSSHTVTTPVTDGAGNVVLGDNGKPQTTTETTTTWRVPTALLSVTVDGDGNTTGWTFDTMTVTPPENSDADFQLDFALVISDDGQDTAMATGSIHVEVDAVADAPELSVGNVGGTEDTAISLNINAALVDVDGSESMSVVIAGVPSGAMLSAGTDNGDGTWTLEPGDLQGLTITPPAQSNDAMHLTVTATSTESNPTTDQDAGTVDTPSASTSASFSVTVIGDADAAEFGDLSASMVEDQVVAGAPNGSVLLDLTSITLGADADDNSEQLSVVLSIPNDAPAGTYLWAPEADDLSYAGNGNWVVSEDAMGSIRLVTPEDYSGEINVDVAITVTERGFQVDDQGNLMLDGNGERIELTGGDKWTTTEQFHVTVIADADEPHISIQAAGHEDMDGGIPFTISPSVTDGNAHGGAEVITSVTVSDIPANVVLMQDGLPLTPDADGNYVFEPDNLDGLTLVTPTHSNEDFQVTVTATAMDNNGDVESNSVVHTVDVVGVADGVNDLVAGQSADATALVLQIAKGTNSAHAGEFEIFIDGESVGTYQTDVFHNNGNDAWDTLTINDVDFSQVDPNSITFQPTSNQSNILIKGVEIAGHTYDPTNGSGDFSVNGDGDGGDYVRMAGNGKELSLDLSGTDFSDMPLNNDIASDGVHQIPIQIESTMIDQDGSESRYYIVSDVPDGAFLAAGVDSDGNAIHAGINAGEGQWIVTEDQLGALHIVPQGGLVTGDHFDITVTAVTVENDGDVNFDSHVTVSIHIDTDLDQSYNPGPGNGHPNSDVAWDGEVSGVSISSGGVGNEDSSIDMGITATSLQGNAGGNDDNDNQGQGSGNHGSGNDGQGSGNHASGNSGQGSGNHGSGNHGSGNHGSGNSGQGSGNHASGNSGHGSGNHASGNSGHGSGNHSSGNSGHGSGNHASGNSGHGSGNHSSGNSGHGSGNHASGNSGHGSGNHSSGNSGHGSGNHSSGNSGHGSGNHASGNSGHGSGNHASGNSGHGSGNHASGNSGHGSGNGGQCSGGHGQNSGNNAIEPPPAADAGNAQSSSAGSEITSFVIADADLPEGASLSAGIFNPLNGTWVFTAEQVETLEVTPPEDFSGEMNIPMQAITIDVNGQELVQDHIVTVDVNAITDGPNIHISPVGGMEDSAIEIQVTLNMPDADGSETLSGVVIVEGVPEGATLSLGEQNPDTGNWEIPVAELTVTGSAEDGTATSWRTDGLTLTPPEDGNTNFNLTFKATGGEGGVDGAEDITVSATVNVNVVADADDVLLTVQDQVVTGLEDTGFELEGLSAVLDGSGAESINVVISGFPEGTTFSHGFNNGDGTWSVAPDDLDDLSVKPPVDFSGNMDLQLTSYSVDRDPDTGEIDIQANSSAEFTVTFEADADIFNASAEDAAGIENSAISLNLSAASLDMSDASPETMLIILDGLPDGSQLSAGTDNGDGTWSLTGDQLNGLTMTPPEEFTGTIHVTMSVSSDQNNVNVVDMDLGFTIEVDDTPVVTMDEMLVYDDIGDGLVDIGSHITITDTDSQNFSGATIAITDGEGAGDSFSFNGFQVSELVADDGSSTFMIDGTNITVSGGGFGGEGDLVLSGVESTDTYENVLHSIQLDVDEPGTRSLSVEVTDEEGATSEAGLFDVAVTQDEIQGTAGDDVMTGTDGNDHLSGGDGNDIFQGGMGDDILSGGAGDDLFIFGMNDGSDFISGGADYNDVIRMDGMTSDPVLDLGDVGNWTIDTNSDFTLQTIDVGGDVFDAITFDAGDAAGYITLEDGTQIDFDGIDQIIW
ncbi:Hemolysin-type calcium-binding region [Magnetococcus marinus MC-1]|uniref:Hemolysin-type calcium-binding region n=2 Tax=Magnetococcus TaxID=162171 RepID=A0L5K7_MAGMM|nr:Hemolysin-type calcium-binding region [Magnetococcus marinus MC-1]